MRVTMFWHGGSSYAQPDTHSARDAEEFDSLRAAKRAFESRTSDSHYPCVDDIPEDDGGPSAWLFKGAAADCLGADYPDFTMCFGPRGGVQVSRA